MTEKGFDIGYVHYTPSKPNENLKLTNIVRRANESDLQKLNENVDLEIKARRIAHDEAKRLKLKMSFQVCKYSLDRKRATLYFTADSRVDFRELVKTLASKLKMRIELWQIGARDETRLFGGIGPCNRELCCSTFYSSRQSVTVRDAKLQGLDINPQKITGMCGKLMCCLKFEVNDYREKMENLPKSGDIVRVDEDEVCIQKVNPYTETVIVSYEDGSVKSFHASEIMVKGDSGWSKVETETEKKEDENQIDILEDISLINDTNISNTTKDNDNKKTRHKSFKPQKQLSNDNEPNKQQNNQTHRNSKSGGKHSHINKTQDSKRSENRNPPGRKFKSSRNDKRNDSTQSKNTHRGSHKRKTPTVENISKYLKDRKKN